MKALKTKQILEFYFSLKIGMPLIIVGLIWMWLVFYDDVYESKLMSLNYKDSKTFEIELKGKGIAYYKISYVNYDQNILFVQIIDPFNNIIAEQKIHTKMSVNYFGYDVDDKYLIRITNLSEKKTDFIVEFGDTHESDLVIPGILTFVGCLMILYFAFKKLKDYSIAHP